MKIKLWVAGVALAVVAPLALAAEGSYFYGAVDLTQGKVSNFCTGIPAGVSCNDRDSGYRVSGGYQIISSMETEGLGVEASYVSPGKTTFSGPSGSAELKDTEFQLALMGTMPMADRLTAIGKVGVAFWKMKTTSSTGASGLSPTGQDFIYGLGAQLEISKSFALRGMFDTHLIGDNVTGRNHMPTLSLGALYRF